MCPICGMPLEPATSGGGGDSDEYGVSIEPAARRLANIQTAPVERRTVEKRLDTIGRLMIDESRQRTIAAYVSGRIERLYADYTGVEVDQGDHLAVIYSPQLYSAQVEYLEGKRSLEGLQGAALATVRQSQERLVKGARQRLVELGMTAEQLAELDRTGEEKSRVTLHSPIAGTVTEKLLVEGKYVDVGEPIYQVANLDTVWLMLQLYPDDAALIRFGQRVDVEVQSLPGRELEGRIAFIDPLVDPLTRTVDVRVELWNRDRNLRPGDYARATIAIALGDQQQVFDADLAGKWISPMHPQIIRDQPGECPICGMDLVSTERYGFATEAVPQPEVLVVPRRAVLMTGSTSLVYVETEQGRFEIRSVKLGPLLRDQAVILSGVAAGEQVATSGNFLIDSQMQLAGKPSLIDPSRAVDRKPEEEGPMKLADGDARRVSGTAGEAIERLYQSYTVLVTTLADDRLPTEAEVAAVSDAAAAVLAVEGLSESLRDAATEVDEQVAHLHHLSLTEARDRFRGISRAILTLASTARGEQAEGDLIHFYCGMVPGGGADWLQAAKPVANPYMGSKMLRCATHEQSLSLPPDETGEDW